MNYLGLKFETTSDSVEVTTPVELTVSRMKDLLIQRYYQGFDENSLQCHWWVEPRTPKEKLIHNYKIQLDQSLRLVEWDQTVFGAIWIEGRPTIVWDDTGMHVFTDEDLLYRFSGSMLIDELKKRGFKYRHHRREVRNLPTDSHDERLRTPDPKRRLFSEVDWLKNI